VASNFGEVIWTPQEYQLGTWLLTYTWNRTTVASYQDPQT